MCTFAEHGGDPRFLRKLEEIAELHSRKQHDYGKDEDPFANIRASADFGVPPWVGAVIRMNDKVTRLKSFVTKGELKNEGVAESLVDIPVYALIALILFEEDNPTPDPAKEESTPDSESKPCGNSCGRPAVAETAPMGLTYCEACLMGFHAGQAYPQDRTVRTDQCE